jgi:protein-arginine kinase activator protein McsA
MICQMCGQSNSEVQINGPHGALHLCPDCALNFLQQSHQPNQAGAPMQNPAQQQAQIQGQMPGQIPGPPPQHAPQMVAVISLPIPHFNREEMIPDLTCAFCKTTFKEFFMTGLFGCPSCYEAFARELRKHLAHSGVRPIHKGKVPARSFKHLRIRKLIERLKGQMKQEVDKENYQTAARLRDTIKSLEAEVEKYS